MDTLPATLTIHQAREGLVCRLAGVLAEASTPSLILELPGRQRETLVPRTTDLPAVLRAAPVGTRLLTPGGGTITLTGEGCVIDRPTRGMVEAFEAISR